MVPLPVPVVQPVPTGPSCAGRYVTAQRKSELRRAEDPIDAVVCAYVALYAQRCPAGVTIYGDFATGYIVTPALPTDLTPDPISDPHGTRDRPAPARR